MMSALLLGLNGCMTTITQVMYFTKDKNVEGWWMVYSGTQGNIRLMTCSVVEGPFEGVGHSPFMGIYGFLDFFQSLALDTAILPLTVGETIHDSVKESDS